MALGIDRPVEWHDDILAGGRRRRHLCQQLGNRLAGDRHAVAVDAAGLVQHLHDQRNAADAVQVGRDVVARRFEIGKHGHSGPDAFEVVQA